MLPTKLRIIWPSGFKGEDFLEINQSETRIVWRPCLLMDWMDGPSRKNMTNAPFQLLSVDPMLKTIQWLCHATWLRQLLLLEGTFHP
jgi:hypothetical protein